MAERRTVTGRIAFPRPLAAQKGLVRVLVEDVSRADAVATIVAETALAPDHALAAGDTLPFSLEVPIESDAQRLNVRVHVDHSGDRMIAEGDMITTQAHPVLTQGAPDHVEVVLQPL
jgi:uncharacterized lipoprotein YbaY